MKLAKWDPFREVEELFDHRSRSLDWPFHGGRELSKRSVDWAPKVDISETKGNFNIKVEVPGVKREDVKINIDDHVLSVHGESKHEKEEESEEFHRVERFYGSFSRSFSLPENVDEDGVEATFKDGLLTLSIPKTEVAKPKAIEIKVK